MLSVIVYGRNDSHGYNPHKRAALSLNCIAQLMDDPDDEIVFVDYNTPDNLPTFIEAIQDTLTERTRRHLRILRVRPAVHDRLRGRTHLQAVESIARNIGARRSNPANRWLLSSNTDMIFVPHRPGHSLTAITGDLEDGFYCLPRFELPENFWELLNRTDPTGAIARVGEWGTRFHLNDIVYGGADILYDAPGDFQLMLRRDLFAIDGFDERMILGWHVDSNISRRLRLLRGAVRGAVDHLYGYHCDHTRQVTLLHGHDRVEDDWKNFVEDVQQPELPDQRDRWGLADEEVEEFTLDRAQGVLYVQALSELLEPMPVRTLESTHSDDGFHNLSYSPSHVLPYLCDVLSGMPRHWNLAYLGCRPSLYGLLRAAWDKLGFTGAILRPEGFGHLDATTEAALPSTTEVYTRATLVLAEFGYGSDDDPALDASRPSDWSLPDTARLTLTVRTFEEFMRAEAERAVPPGEPPRYFITVNAIFNIFENSVLSNLSVTYTPYSSRVRHGPLLRARLPAPTLERRAMGRWLQTRLGRQAPVPFNELSHLLRLAISLLRDDVIPDNHPASSSALLAVPLLGLLDHPNLSDLAGVQLARIDALRARIDAARPSRALRAAIPVSSSPPAATPSRMAAIEAWEDPDWRCWAHRHFGGANAYNYFDRGTWNWERIHLLHTLDRLDALGDTKAVLVVAGEPDALYAVLTQHAGRVDVANPGPAPATTEHAARWQRPIELLLPDRLRVIHRALDNGDALQPAYDAVVFVGDRLFGYGAATVAPLLAWARRHLLPTGILAFSGQLLLDGERPDHWLTGRRAADGDVERLLARHAGFEPIGGFDATLSDATLDRLDDLAAGWSHHGHFVTRNDGALFATGLWFLRRGVDGPDDASDDALRETLGEALHGDLIRAMQPGAAVTVGPEGITVNRDASAGLALFGPYLRLPAGRYRLRAEVVVGETDDDTVGGMASRRPVLTVEVKAADEVEPLGWWDIAPTDLTDGRIDLAFDVPERLDPLIGRGAAIEFPMHHFGETTLVIRTLRLDRIPADTLPMSALRLSPLARMQPTSFAEPQPSGVAAEPEAPSADLLYGPNLRLPAGRYQLWVDAAPRRPAYVRRGVLTVTVMAGASIVEQWWDLRAADLLDGPAAVLFDVPPDRAMTAANGGLPHEFRVAHLGGLGVTLRDLRLERLPSLSPANPSADGLSADGLSIDLLTRMSVPDGIPRDGTAVTAIVGTPGLLLFGPYLPLRGGLYRLTLMTVVPDGHDPCDTLLSVRVTAGSAKTALWRDLVASDLATGSTTIDMTLPDDGMAAWEFQITHNGRAHVTILALDLIRLRDGEVHPMPKLALAPLWSMTHAATAQREGVGAMSGDERVEPFLYGPYLRLPTGGYHLTLTATVEGVAPDRAALGLEIAADGYPILMTDLSANRLADGSAIIDFSVPPEHATVSGEGGAAFEFRLTRLAGRVTVTDLRVTAARDQAHDQTPDTLPVDIALLPRLIAGATGERTGDVVSAGEGDGRVEPFLYGPYLPLPTGEGAPPDRAALGLEIAADGCPILMTDLSVNRLADGPVTIDFSVPPEHAALSGGKGAAFEFRLTRLAGRVAVAGLQLTATRDQTLTVFSIDVALLPRLVKGAIGERTGGTIRVGRKEAAGTLLFGPYLRLPAGRYEVTLVGAAKIGLFTRNKPVLTAQVILAGATLADPVPFTNTDLVGGEARLTFTVTAKQTGGTMEVVIAHTGKGDVVLQAVSLRRTELAA
jgi:hypothetical protein